MKPSISNDTLVIAIARAAINEAFGQTCDSLPTTAWLAAPGASFVTLRHMGRHKGQLRGCVGSVNVHRSLGQDIKANAYAAAFRDPRFTPLSETEWPEICVEVSVLSPLQALTHIEEADVLQQLRPGIDGLLLEYLGHRGTFLPQVWEQFPEPNLFLQQLKRKTGLADSFWQQAIRVSRYTVTHYTEAETS